MMIRKGFLKERLRNKALKSLTRDNPHFTTTQALWLINAKCGAAKFHKILQRRNLATPVEPWDKGYKFNLPPEYGSGTCSIKDHCSFAWSIAGVKFMSEILASERIVFEMPKELIEKVK
jgi:hypothetical protein